MLVLPYPLEGRPDEEVDSIADRRVRQDSSPPSASHVDELVSATIEIEDDTDVLYEMLARLEGGATACRSSRRPRAASAS